MNEKTMRELCEKYGLGCLEDDPDHPIYKEGAVIHFTNRPPANRMGHQTFGLREPPEEILDDMPGAHETEHIPIDEKMLVLHFIGGASKWYAAEFDGEKRRFYGFVTDENPANTAWTYFSLGEFLLLNLERVGQNVKA